MIIRFQSRNGQFRLTLDADADVASTLPAVLEKLPKDTIPSTVTISPKPHGAESRAIETLQGISFARLGLKHGTQVFLDYKEATATDVRSDSAAPPDSSHRLNGRDVAPEDDRSSVAIPSVQARALIKNPWESVKQSELDDKLDKLDGKISRRKDEKMCRHGPKGMCDYCMPLEPYDKAYLEEKKIKHLSYHSYLRKINHGKKQVSIWHFLHATTQRTIFPSQSRLSQWTPSLSGSNLFQMPTFIDHTTTSRISYG